MTLSSWSGEYIVVVAPVVDEVMLENDFLVCYGANIYPTCDVFKLSNEEISLVRTVSQHSVCLILK